MQPVEYLIFADNELIELKCMTGCGATIGKFNERRQKFVHWQNYRAWPVRLADGSFQNMLVCVSCLPHCSEVSLKRFELTRDWGWQRDMEVRGKLAKNLVETIMKKSKEPKTIIGPWE